MAKLDAGAMSIPKDEPLNLAEIAAGNHHRSSIEAPAIDIANKDAVELERFMHEPVKITLAEGQNEGDVDAVPVTVCGVTQWLIRGVSQEVRRKYVEVLLRARTTSYKQSQARVDLTDSRPEPKTVMSYAFSIDHDTERGRAWAQEILAQKL